MEGAVLLHVSEKQGTRLRELFYTKVSRDARVYCIPHWESPAKGIEKLVDNLTLIEEYAPHESLEAVFLRTKQRMLQDGVDYAKICGQAVKECITELACLLNGEVKSPSDGSRGWPDIEIWPTAMQMGWDDRTYQKVLGTVIPTTILYELSI